MSPRPRRPPYIRDNYYHIYNRGAGKARIFREVENYLFVIRKMKTYSRDFHLTIIAYCLMPNHYHMLVRQDGEFRAGLLPQRVFNSYTKAFNTRYGQSGTLFEGPYRAVHVTKVGHLRHLCRYIHANPVKDGLVKSLDDWPYSNFLDWIGRRQGTLLDRVFIDDCFDSLDIYLESVKDFLVLRELPVELDEYLE